MPTNPETISTGGLKDKSFITGVHKLERPYGIRLEYTYSLEEQGVGISMGMFSGGVNKSWIGATPLQSLPSVGS